MSEEQQGGECAYNRMNDRKTAHEFRKLTEAVKALQAMVKDLDFILNKRKSTAEFDALILFYTGYCLPFPVLLCKGQTSSF